jgi:hypothetical protein
LIIEIYWRKEWFRFSFKRVPTGYWKDKENQKEFFQKFAIGKIKKPSDWGKITRKMIALEGGAHILKKTTLRRALQSSFPSMFFFFILKFSHFF